MFFYIGVTFFILIHFSLNHHYNIVVVHLVALMIGEQIYFIFYWYCTFFSNVLNVFAVRFFNLNIHSTTIIYNTINYNPPHNL